jgi:transcriptional regulator with XRE-family HTH domain
VAEARQREGSRRIVGHTLRELRTAKGWSQTTLARMVGVSQTTIWYVERGQRRPGPTTRERIAGLLGVAPAAIDWSAPDSGQPGDASPAGRSGA